MFDVKREGNSQNAQQPVPPETNEANANNVHRERPTA
jgi:hypothetical protein